MKIFRNKISHRGGFTLIELLVVIAIISLLSSVVLASLRTARDKALFAKALVSMNSLNTEATNCMIANSALTIPAHNGNPGSVVCASNAFIIPNITDTRFVYCGLNCWGWTSDPSSGGYAISIYSDSYSGGRKIIVCGSDVDVTGWYGLPFDLRGQTACVKYGF